MSDLVSVSDCIDCGEQFTGQPGELRPVCGDCLQKRAKLPEAIWLCPACADEFWMPHGGTCPVCPRELVRYSRVEKEEETPVSGGVGAVPQEAE